MTSWTTQQILSLAPDPASAKAGQGLASAAKWAVLGYSDTAVWGECQGSGSSPYQVQIDLSEPAFKCTCPSRKFPCKHGLALFLLFVNSTASLKPAEMPPWVTEWFAKRQDKTEKKKETADRPLSEADLAKSAEEQAKRAAQRQKKVSQGLADLELWLRDLVRHGLAAVPSRPYKFWDEPAARLVDAQAPGVARLVREMASIPASGEGWQARLVERLGLITLLIEAYRRIETLPEPVQADVRDAIGWNVRQETVLTSSGIQDVWMVLGQRSEEEEQFRVSRTWLRGRDTGRDALVLQFTRQGQPMETLLAPGTSFPGEVAFFPGAWPLRALIKERGPAVPFSDCFPAYTDGEALLSAFAHALGHNPGIREFAAPLGPVTPVLSGERMCLIDAQDQVLPIRHPFTAGWKLLAISGGHPVHVFGEWDGSTLLPLSVWADCRFIALF